MKTIGLIDVDNRSNTNNCFPNLVLMKLSAYHKSINDHVEWYKPSGIYDVVYASKVFSFSKEQQEVINSKTVIYGGSGYCIKLVDGKEVFDNSLHYNLPDHIEHIYPDYELYGIKNTAYGFMSRGCPRNCEFCIVGDKEGCKSYKVADLHEFWNGQKNIELLDPNTFACQEWKSICEQLIESKANVNFNQGVDIRLLNDEKLQYLSKIKVKKVHFAYDQMKDKDLIEPKLKKLAELTGWNRAKVTVYVLTNFNTTIDQDLHRINYIRSLGFQPYVMRYNKEFIKRGSLINKLARWVNTPMIFWSIDDFYQYCEEVKTGKWI